MNNLKTERTLTAEDRVSDERLADLLERGSYRMYQSVFPMELSSMLAELKALRSQSLSTQQPMGEVTNSMIFAATERASEFGVELKDWQANSILLSALNVRG